MLIQVFIILIFLLLNKLANHVFKVLSDHVLVYLIADIVLDPLRFNQSFPVIGVLHGSKAQGLYLEVFFKLKLKPQHWLDSIFEIDPSRKSLDSQKFPQTIFHGLVIDEGMLLHTIAL